jgi:4-amino-4-deoxy-L-arabinose transferase
MTANKTLPLLTLALFVLIYLVPLGARPLFVPDEARYGEIAREMIADHDWVVPRLNGLRYFEKPVMGYWLHAGAILLCGENGFAIRLPSAAAVGLSALMIFLLVRLTLRKHEPEQAWQASVGALAFLVCFEVFGVGTFSVLDSLLALFLTATMTAFFLATSAAPGSRREKLMLLLAGIACGLAFLTKGFLALAVPVLAIVPFLLWQRRYADLPRLAWLPLAAAIAVSLPWSIMIHLQEPDFWHFFFWNEHVHRFLSKNAQHQASFWFYFLAAPAMFLPWTFLIPAAAGGVRHNLKNSTPAAALLRYCLCWAIFPFLFFSASSGKLLTYILPCFPPFAILMTLGLAHTLNQGRGRAFRYGAVLMGLVSTLLLAALLFLQLVGYHDLLPYSRTWKWLLLATGLGVMALCSLLALRARETAGKMAGLALAPALLFLSLPVIMPDSLLLSKAPAALLQRHKRDVGPATIIIADEEIMPAANWTFQRDDAYLLENPGEVSYGLGYAEAKGRLLDLADANRLLAANPGQVVIVARERNFTKWAPHLPPPVMTDDSGPKGYVFVKY